VTAPIYVLFQVRFDTAAMWASANPVLDVGEPGYAYDTKILKIGDGVTPWLSLPGFTTTVDLAGKVSKTGDTMTGNLIIDRDGQATEARLSIGADANQLSAIVLRGDSEDRWQIHKNFDTESGSNAGSNFDIVRCDDTGTAVSIVMRAYRQSGVVDFPHGINIGTPPGAAADNIQVPDTAWVRDRLDERRLVATANLNFPSTSNTASSDLTVNVPGAVLGDVVALGPPAGLAANFAWCGWVSAADTVTVRLIRTTTGVDPAAGDWKVMVLK
jgi:hypothetical protein